METRLVRLKAHDPKRGHFLRRYSFRGLKFQVERGWYRVSMDVADYLAQVRQVPSDPHSPHAFDVCTEEEAQRIDVEEAKEQKPTLAADAIKLAVPRGDEVDATGKGRRDESKAKRAKAPAPDAP